MNAILRVFTFVSLPLAACLALAPAGAQTARQQAEKELAKKPQAGGVQACTLITRADVTKATGSDPLVDPEQAGQGGWLCNVGVGELKVYSGANSWESWESTRKAFKKEQEPTTPAPAFGERAYFFYPTPDNQYQGNVAFLVVNRGNYTLALSLDAPRGKPASSMRPALETLMKTALTRLP